MIAEYPLYLGAVLLHSVPNFEETATEVSDFKNQATSGLAHCTAQSPGYLTIFWLLQTHQERLKDTNKCGSVSEIKDEVKRY